MATIQDLAKEAYSYFELAERSNGDTYYRTKDTHPQWVYNLAYKGHHDGGYLPDDWCYRFIVYALSDLSDGDEEVESYPFFSNPDALDWLGTNLWRGGYCDEVLEEYGPIDSIWKIMIGGMEREYDEVFYIVKDFLEEMVNEEEEDE